MHSFTRADRRRLATRLGFDIDLECMKAFNGSVFMPHEVEHAFDKGFQSGCEYMFRVLCVLLPESVTGPRPLPAVQPGFDDPPAPSNREYVHMLTMTGALPDRYLEARREAVIDGRGDDVRRAWTQSYDEAFDAAVRLLHPYLPEHIHNTKEETE